MRLWRKTFQPILDANNALFELAVQDAVPDRRGVILRDGAIEGRDSAAEPLFEQYEAGRHVRA
jgi:hypothetical protein